MLRALLAFLALLLPGPAHVAIEAPDAESPDRVGELFLDASRLPGPTGFFLVPVTVTEDAVVDVEAWLAVDERAPGRAAAVLVGSTERGASWAVAAMGSTAGRGDPASSALACCTRAVPAAGAALSLVDGRESRLRAAGETLWVGLVATSWGGGSWLSLRVSAAAPVLRVGEAVTGAAAERVDLAAEARRDAPGNLLDDADLTRNVSRAWTAKGTGLLVLDASARGGASARLHATLPQGPLFAGETLKDRRLQVVALQPGGAVAVGLHELEEPPAWRVTAVALYADLPPMLHVLHVRALSPAHGDVVEPSAVATGRQ